MLMNIKDSEVYEAFYMTLTSSINIFNHVLDFSYHLKNTSVSKLQVKSTKQR